MMTRKGVYPYSYMNKWSKFDVNPKKLKLKHFTNDLTGEKISDDDFQFFGDVCQKFNIKNLGEYHDLYLKTDILLLADVFENFRKMCLANYGLDPCHYYTDPGFAWDACLKMTGIELESISDIDMHLFFEQGMRGGVSIITHRKGTANHKYMEHYDPKKPSKYILDLDANNLYGWSMSQSMPYKGFKWINPMNFRLRSTKSFVVTNSTRAISWNVTLNTPVSYMIYIMTIHIVQNKLLLNLKCYQIIQAILLNNTILKTMNLLNLYQI